MASPVRRMPPAAMPRWHCVRGRRWELNVGHEDVIDDTALLNVGPEGEGHRSSDAVPQSPVTPQEAAERVLVENAPDVAGVVWPLPDAGSEDPP